MKKSLKIFLTISLIIILGAGSYLLYLFKFKDYDVADNEIDKIMEDTYSIELPDGTVITVDGEEPAPDKIEEDTADSDAATSGTSDNDSSSDTSSNSNTSSGTNSNNNTVSSTTESSPGTPGTGTSGKNDAAKETTVASIKGKYTPAFESLQSQADGKLNSLIGRAKKEFSDNKAQGKKIDFPYFYNKYYGAAEALEGQTDTVFNSVLNAVEKDLAANGYDKSYAQSYADDYNARKKARRDELLKKAMN
ncbi:hypothetical protein ACFSFY_14610 [Sporosarcina siberiensis]|uniref:Uncharacterized protein n=1 Tax=Sporosarcina siberiensis TaxID=1365606 RepID=A0ABW4SJG4_9BACL